MHLQKNRFKSILFSSGHHATGGLWNRGDYSYQCCWFSNKVKLFFATLLCLFSGTSSTFSYIVFFCPAGLLSKLFCNDTDYLQNILILSLELFVRVSMFILGPNWSLKVGQMFYIWSDGFSLPVICLLYKIYTQFYSLPGTFPLGVWIQDLTKNKPKNPAT